MNNSHPADIKEIQNAIATEGLDGWLFFDHHRRDALAYRVLKFKPIGSVSRRWYYFIPAKGEPRGLVHAIETHTLDPLAGTKFVYRDWESQQSGVKRLLNGSRRIAMQYSPLCAIPYVSNVDGGTLELVRGSGVDIVSSADLIQQFEARWTREQYESHIAAGKLVDEVRREAFALVGRRLREGASIDEYGVKTFVRESFDKAGLTAEDGPIVAVNEHMSDPHYDPEADSASPIRAGDPLLLDMWAKLRSEGAVFYDITWTGFCGKAVPEKIAEV